MIDENQTIDALITQIEQKKEKEKEGLSVKSLSQYLKGIEPQNRNSLNDACNSGVAVDFFNKKTIQQQIANEENQKNTLIHHIWKTMAEECRNC